MPLSLCRRRPRPVRSSPVTFCPHLVALEGRVVPAGLPTQWVQRGAGGGGALFSPAINPANANEITVASDMSQLFRTTDAGATWQATDFRALQANHESRVFFTNDPTVRYALDYSAVDLADLTRPSKSTDGGQTWQPIASDPTGGEAFYLQADPTNKDRLLVTDFTRLWFSGNGGASWGLKYTSPNAAGGLLVGGSFWDGATVYVGTSDGVLVTTNGGTSFAVAAVGGLPAGHAIQSFAGAKQGGVTRFVAVTQAAGDLYAGIQGYDNGGGTAVATLDWGAANWTVRTLPGSAWPWFAGMALADINTAYVAGGSSAGAPTVYKTTNGGASWTSVFQTTNNANIATGWSGQGGERGWGYGELAMGFAVAGNSANTLIITDYGFAHSSTDGGATWKALYVNPADRNAAGANIPAGKFYRDSGLDNTTAWQVAWADANTLIVANSDVNGQRSTDGGQSFTMRLSGQTFNSLYRVAVGPTGTLYAAVGTVHDLYQSTYLTDARIDGGTGGVLFSTDKGATWQTLYNAGRVTCWVALDPTNPNRLYAAVAHSTQGGIYVTNNLSAGAASTWTKLPNPPRTEGHAFNVVVLNDGKVLASYSGRRTTNFTASSGVFLYDPATNSWSDRSGPAGFNGLKYWTKDVVVDPADAQQNTWYAAVYSGWGGQANGLGGLYRTTDRGLNWTRITTGLDRVGSITFNPTDPNEAFLTTEVQGLWHSTNARAATPTYTPVAAYPFRQPERVFWNPSNANEIWVTSFGNGIRVGTVAAAAPPRVTGTQVNDGTAQRSRVTSLTVTFNAQVTLPANPALAFTLNRTGGGTVTFTATASAIGGVTVVTLTNFTGTATEFGSLADGRYTLTALANQISAGGQGLDGNGDGTAGDNYTIGDAQGLFRYYGDVNGDRTVNGLDFALFRPAFGTGTGSPTYLAYLDVNGDGAINGLDFGEFRTRFGLPLP